MGKLEKQPCPFCHQNTLTLTEEEKEIPYFGKCYLFSMHCSSCSYHKADLEAKQQKEPIKYEIDIASSKDLSIRVVKSSEATVKIPTFKISVTPGSDSEGYITNIEGILQRFKKVVEVERDTTEDDEAKKKAKNLLKKMWKAESGYLPFKVIIEDPSGNSAIISEKAVIGKLKK